MGEIKGFEELCKETTIQKLTEVKSMLEKGEVEDIEIFEIPDLFFMTEMENGGRDISEEKAKENLKIWEEENSKLFDFLDTKYSIFKFFSFRKKELRYISDGVIHYFGRALSRAEEYADESETIPESIDNMLGIINKEVI